MSTSPFKRNRIRQAILMSAAISLPFVGAYSRLAHADCTGGEGDYVCEGEIVIDYLIGAPLNITTTAAIQAPAGLLLDGVGGITFTDLQANEQPVSEIGSDSSLGLLAYNAGGHVTIATSANFRSNMTLANGISVYNSPGGAAGRGDITISSASAIEAMLGISAVNTGLGDISIDVSGEMNTAAGILAYNVGEYAEDESLDQRALGINLAADLVSEFVGISGLALVGDINVSTSADISVESGRGIWFGGFGNSGDIVLDIDGDVTSYAESIRVASGSRLGSDISIDVSGDLSSEISDGIWASNYDYVEAGWIAGDIDIITTGSITAADNGIIARLGEGGSLSVAASGSIDAGGTGIFAEIYGEGDVSIISAGDIKSGEYGIFAAVSKGDIDITVQGTLGRSHDADSSHEAVTARIMESGDISLSLDGRIEDYENAVYAYTSEGNISIDMSADSVIESVVGIYLDAPGGDVELNIDGTVNAERWAIGAEKYGRGLLNANVSGTVRSESTTGISLYAEDLGDIDLAISGLVESRGKSYNGLEVETWEQDGDINVSVAEGGSIQSAGDAIAISSDHRLGGETHVSVAGEITAGEGFSAIWIEAWADEESSHKEHFTLELQSGWALNGDVQLIDIPAATLRLAGDMDSSFDLSRLSSSGDPDGTRIFGMTDFVKTGDSSFTLNNEALNFEGFNSAQITGGSLVLDNTSFRMSESASAFAVGAGTALHLNNSSIDGDLNNDGLILLAAEQRGTVTGDYQQSADAILQIGVNNDTSYGQLVVEGSAQFAEGAKIVVDLADPRFSFTSAVRAGMPNIVAASSIESDGFVVSDNSLLFDFAAEVNDEGTQIGLSLDSPAAYDGVEAVLGKQANLSGMPAASVIDRLITDFLDTGNPGSFGAAIDAFAAMETEAEISATVSQLLPMLSGTSPQVVSQLMFSVDRILQQRRSAPAGGASGDSLLQNGQLWLRPFGSWAEQDGREGIKGYEADSRGMVLGADSLLAGNRSLGMALVYARSTVDSRNTVLPQGSEVDSYQLRIHGAQPLSSATTLNLQADLGYHQTDSRRSLSIGGSSYLASADYSSSSFHLGAGLSHALWANANMDFSLSGSADYSWVADESYRESGADALSLEVSEDRSEELLLAVDGELNYWFGERNLLSTNLGLGYDVINDQDGVTAAFSGAPQLRFQTAGLDRDPLMARFGLGFERRMNEGLSTSLRYDVEGREDFSNQTASFNVNWSF